MNGMRLKNCFGVGLAAAAFVAVSTFAYGGTASALEATEKTEARHAAEEKKAALQEQVEQKRAAAQERAEQAKTEAKARVAENKQRLEGKKLEACEVREQRINRTMEQMTTRGENHIAVFTKITDRVKTFYAEKGKTVTNYDVLVADIDAKKQAAEAAVESARSVGDVFSCDSDSPKIASEQFREAHKAQVAALKEYRTSVKNLIEAVKSAQSTETKNSNDEGATNE
jgi:hypothetical protein